MKQGGNANHPKKGSRIAVDPIREIKDIKAISILTSGNPRDHLLFVMGINNGLRACDLVKVKVGDIRYMKVGDTLTKDRLDKWPIYYIFKDCFGLHLFGANPRPIQINYMNVLKGEFYGFTVFPKAARK
jgi:hypothetical protein